MSFKAPSFRWTTDAEFQGLVASMAPVVDQVVTQAGAKGETALEESAQALKKALATKDRKTVGAAAKKMEDAAKAAKDKDLKAKAGEVGKKLATHAGQFLDKVLSADNFKYSLYIALAYLLIGIIGMALMGEQVGFFITGFPFVFIIS